MQNVQTIQETAAIMPLLSSSSALKNLSHLMSSLNLHSVKIVKGKYGARFNAVSLDNHIDGANKTNVKAFTSITNQVLRRYLSKPLLSSQVKASRGKKKQNINQFLADEKASREFIEAIGAHIDADTVLFYFEQTGLDSSLPVPGIVHTTYIEVTIDAIFDACNNIKTNIIPQARAKAMQSRASRLQ